MHLCDRFQVSVLAVVKLGNGNSAAFEHGAPSAIGFAILLCSVFRFQYLHQFQAACFTPLITSRPTTAWMTLSYIANQSDSECLSSEIYVLLGVIG